VAADEQGVLPPGEGMARGRRSARTGTRALVLAPRSGHRLGAGSRSREPFAVRPRRAWGREVIISRSEPSAADSSRQCHVRQRRSASTAALVRTALVRTALVRTALVRTALVRTALIRTALIRTALIRAGCPTAGPTPSNWCHWGFWAGHQPRVGTTRRGHTPRWHHSARAHPCWHHSARTHPALAPLGADTPRWHHSARTHPALAPLDADTPRAGTTRRGGPGRVRVGGSSRRRPKPARRPAPRALRPLHPR
jgi:hypothetical protein